MLKITTLDYNDYSITCNNKTNIIKVYVTSKK